MPLSPESVPLVRLPARPGARAKPPVRAPLPAIPWPHAAEHSYVASLLFVAKQASAGVRTRVLPRLRALMDLAADRLPSGRTDAKDESYAVRLAALMAELRAEFGVPPKTARRWALSMLSEVSGAHAASFVSMYANSIAINPLAGNEAWLSPLMDVALEQNVQLITSIPTQLYDQTETLVRTAVMSGTRVEELAQQLAARFPVTESRAMLIARDQTGSWFGALQHHRQVDAGITEYTWSTSQDERVRKSHRAREGKRFTWKDGPADGRHPGEEVMCRCAALPHIDDWDALTAGEE
jgi:SPP1 gp7 family putative phage head morphogenesis protein